MDIDHQRPTVLSKLKKALSIATVLFLLYWTLRKPNLSQNQENRVIFSVMGRKHQFLLAVKKFRRPICVSLFILFLSLLYGTYRTSSTIHLWIKYYKAALSPPNLDQLRLPQNIILGKIVPQRQYASVVAVQKTKTLLISAYLEHRTYIKMVRVIALVLQSETVEYRCLFYCQNKLLISEGVDNIHSDHFDFAYATADIMCHLPSGCETPTYIALMSAAADPADDLNEAFLEVKNKQVKTDSFPYNFTVCVTAMFDFTNVLQLVQSLEMLQLLGVDRVVIYKTNCSSEIQRLLDYYTDRGLVEVIPWPVSRFVKVSHGWRPESDPGDLHYFGQIAALNDCIYRHMYQSRYVALNDLDELILPQTVNSWLELLPLLEKKYGANKCYLFENNVFPTTITLPPPASQTLPPQGHWEKVSGVNILVHLYQEPVIWKFRFNDRKIIVNPRAVFAPTVHGMLDSQHGCSWIDRNIARMYHTRVPKQPKLTPDKLIYDGRLLSYSARLTPAVSKVLRETRFLPEDNTH